MLNQVKIISGCIGVLFSTSAKNTTWLSYNNYIDQLLVRKLCKILLYRWIQIRATISKYAPFLVENTSDFPNHLQQAIPEGRSKTNWLEKVIHKKSYINDHHMQTFIAYTVVDTLNNLEFLKFILNYMSEMFLDRLYIGSSYH